MSTNAKATSPLLEAPEAGTERATPASSGPVAGTRSRPLRTIVFAILLVAGLAWTARYVQRMLTHAETDNAYVTGHLHQVSPRIAGTIIEVLAEENTRVEAGAPLVRLDPRDNDTKVVQAQALL